MRQFLIAGLLVLMIFCLNACDRTSEPTTSELLVALGMNTWQVRMPDYMTDDTFVSVMLQCADGTEIGRRSGSTGLRANEIVRVFLWLDEDRERTRYAVVGERTSWRSSLRNPFPINIQTRSFSDRIAAPNDYLMKTSDGESVSSDKALRQGECGFTVIVDHR